MLRSPAMSSVRNACASLLLCGVAAGAGAADFKSVGNDPAILYDAPTLRGTRLFVAPRGMPVELIVAQGDWARVRDSSGGLSWGREEDPGRQAHARRERAVGHGRDPYGAR